VKTASIPAFDSQRTPRDASRLDLPGSLLISLRAHCVAASENFAELIPHRRP